MPVLKAEETNAMSISKLFRVLCIFLIISVLFVCAGFSVAATSYDEVPYRTYTYWEGYTVKKPVAMKEMYSVSNILDYTTDSQIDFAEIQHIYIDSNGYLYVLDGYNAAITVLDENYRVIKKISELNFNGEKISFQHAEGIFVNEDGRLYIADTENLRIIVLSPEGAVESIIKKPNSPLLPEGFNFAPIKLLQDTEGFLYVLCDGCYYGAMKFSSEYEFLGFYGANVVNTSVISSIDGFISNLFMTEARRMNDIQKLPYTFLNFCVDDDGFIFTTTDNQKAQVRRLGPGGTNILSKKYNFKTTSGDNIVFGDISGVKDEQNITKKNEFSAIAVNGKFFYLLDRVTGRIFVYDFDCNLITVFSGGFGSGIQQGTFQTPTSIAINKNGDILVSDFEKGCIVVFTLTEYGQSVMQAAEYNINGEYDKAERYWEEVLSQDENNQMAYIGIGKAAMMRGDYETAVKYSEIGLDQETYSRAYGELSLAFLKENFFWIFLTAIAIVGGITAILIVTAKKRVVLIKNPIYNTAASMLFHPKISLCRIKDKNLGSVWIATALLGLFFITKTASDIYPGFMYVVPDNTSYNVIYTFMGTVVLVLLWVVVNWGVCVLFEGKGKLKEIYISTCYSLIPLIIYFLIFIVLSYFMTPSNVSFLGLFRNLCYIYFVIILLVSVMVIHEFDFTHAFFTSLFTVLGMLIVAFMIFMTLTLCQDFVSFIFSIVQESVLR